MRKVACLAVFMALMMLVPVQAGENVSIQQSDAEEEDPRQPSKENKTMYMFWDDSMTKAWTHFNVSDEKSIDEAEAYYLKCVEIDNRCVDAMFNWATLKLHCRKDPDACRVLINQIVVIEPELKDHKLVKLLRGDEDA